MQKKSPSEAGFFNLRVILAFALCSGALALGIAVFAAPSPTSGTLSPANPSITYTGGPFIIATNSTDNASGPVTCDATNPCEDFGLTINIPQSYITAHPSDYVKIEISWGGTGQDLDTWLVNNPDNGAYPAHGTNGGDDPEVITVPIANIPAGPQQYFVRVAPFISTGQNYTGKITLVSPAAPTPTPVPAPPPPTSPRYYNYAPGSGVGETAGEPSIGYNLISHKAMYISGLQTLRVTFPETGACEANWEDVSYLVTKTRSLDPILFTDQRTGRTFVSQLDSVPPPAGPSLIFAGLNSFMAYTDDDGATWTPAQINPPDGSYDHQTVGAGPYPLLLPLGNAINKGEAVYYCSQAGVTAFCSRSDDGGLNFGRSTAIYNAVTDGCGGIHGHVKVAPDGTVYVPNRGCNGVQSLAVSDNAGTTWTVRPVQGPGFTAAAPSVILDPSVAIASDGTLYFSWISGAAADAGHVHVAVSHDRGQTWAHDTDIGAMQGINNAVFVEAVAGDPDRAAIGFVGTTEPGDHESITFQGTWYVFIAHTYDGGQNWVTVNATPNAPVQRNAGIWNEGGSNPLRNLLDFNEITMDEKGRVLYGFADGCVDDCETGAPNSFTAKASIARQSGGKGLLAQFDPIPAEPVAPQTACLSGHRDDLASYLQWRAPDNGGAPITAYKIYRGTAPGNEVYIGQATGTKTSFTDRSADPTITYTYKVTAVNSSGESQPSNIVTLPVGPRVEPTGACSLPGVQVLIDPAGDENDGVAKHDVTSLSISEPDSLPGKLVFTLKIADLTPPLTPAFRWSVRFSVPTYGPPDSAVIGPQEDWFVSMITSDSSVPTFTYGTTGSFTPAGATVPARFFTTIGNLDPASTFTTDGTITLILDKAAFQQGKCAGVCAPVQPGQAININLASVRAAPPSVVPGAGGTNETIPDTTGPGFYHLRSANLCLPNTAPLAGLTADVDTGIKPLTVHFDGSSSLDPDAPLDTIASYIFNFGEGGDDVVQSTPTITHTFASSGLYDVKLVVTDSRGKSSSNTAHRLVQVKVPLQVVSRLTHGAGGAFDINLPLTGKPGVECRNGNGTYQMVFTFANPLTSVGGASMTGTGTISNRSLGTDPHQYVVDLTGVTDAQMVTVTLNSIVDSTGPIPSVTGTMGVLLGDTTGNGAVNSSDISQTQSESGHALSQTNFREDVTLNNSINSSDISIVQSKSGNAIPNFANIQAGAPAAASTGTTAAPASPKGKRAPRSKPTTTRNPNG